ncbi:MAG: acyltransferase [Methylobacter sp.]|nr:acyltransferase [Methylobacter sp.]
MGGLRFILALSVVFHHIPGQPFMLLHGGVAVEAFFIISGFYMAFVINEKYATTNAPWVLTFYLNRILRLFPAYLIACAVKLYFCNSSHTPNVFSTHNDVTPQAQAVLIYLNIFIVGQDLWQMLIDHTSQGIPNVVIDRTVAFFDASSLNRVYLFISQAWSLSVEIMFYALAPFVVLSKRRVLLFFLACLMVRLYFLQNSDIFPNDPWRSRFFVCNFPLFFLGVMSYWIYTKAKDLKSSKYMGMVALLVGTVGMVFSVCKFDGAFLFSGSENYDQPRLWFFYIALALAIPYLFILSKQSLIDGYIGELSYPIYLVHGFVIRNVALHFPLYSPVTVMLIITALSIVISVVLYILVDRPVDKFRHKLSTKTYTEKTRKLISRLALGLPVLLVSIVFLIQA